MLERLVLVPDILKPMYLLFLRKQRRSDGMDGRIPPSFIVEPTGFVEVFKEGHVCIGTPEVQVTNFKVRPDL
jgi:hypothetical protein